ncbi:hypothetical protein VFPPC_11972 [Pochonia chlamydosporia 170]|uniref:Uncharacterized protein n=1 Tax=Pochonia chlamydosporia 170 TaxID=1380566 RepID=A0A179F0X8_METCM|nr:hypothetical protein VFPPC_11972 [Pochonia chlamydosporia 170]OAQ59052.1 hypothetical protein VFPPC_11972 [Pochonia chlamydosporia 170]
MVVSPLGSPSLSMVQSSGRAGLAPPLPKPQVAVTSTSPHIFRPHSTWAVSRHPSDKFTPHEGLTQRVTCVSIQKGKGDPDKDIGV